MITDKSVTSGKCVFAPSTPSETLIKTVPRTKEGGGRMTAAAVNQIRSRQHHQNQQHQQHQQHLWMEPRLHQLNPL